MEVVLAGDIIGSRDDDQQIYLEVIQPILDRFSKSGRYQIYRGDSFQMQVEYPFLGLWTAILLKSGLRKTGFLDVRIAIGLGDLNVRENEISKSTGSALIRSGELLDSLKEKNQNIMINGGSILDHYINTALKLALLYMDEWTVNSAEVIYEMYKNPLIGIHPILKRESLTQEDLGKILGIKQASASRRLKRAHFEETDALSHLFLEYYNHLTDGIIN